MTGVQRYAAGIVQHLDVLLSEGHARDLEMEMLAPRRMRQRHPSFHAIHLRQVGVSGGPLWEQTTLAGLHAPLLLCLGNTAPVLRARKITCIHDVNVKLAPESYSPAFRTYYGAITPAVIATSLLIVTVSEFSAGQLTRLYGVKTENIHIIPNGHEHVFDWQPSRTTLDTASLLERPFFLVVGSRASHKNLAVIMQIAERIRSYGVNLVVAGAGGAEFADNDLFGRAFLNFLGAVTDDDLAWLYRHALGLLFPSRLEGFGIPIVEAMALGCPVIASTAASMPSVGGDAAIYAAPDEPDEWFAAATGLIGNPSLRHDLAARGRRRVSLFSWRRSAELYLDLLQKFA